MKKKNVIKTEDVIGTIESVLKQFNASGFMLRMRRIHDIENATSKWSKEKRSKKKWLKHIDSKKTENVTKRLQEPLKEKLAEAFKNTYRELKWGIEQKLKTGYRDCADIRAIDHPNWEIIIEIDTARADQVGKKFVSRFAHILKNRPKNIVYMVLCYYSKTYNKKSKNKKSKNDECRKYIDYGEELLKKVHGSAFFISAFVDNDKIEIEKIPQFSATPSSAQV